VRIWICTDLEGVAGVMNYQDYLFADSRYYEKAKRLLTQEVNAAIEGFSQAGAGEFIVADGHGAGAIDQELLDGRAMLLRGHPGPYPFGMELDCDVAAFIGQHAMSRTPYAHLPHTQWHGVFDCTVNGLRVGEFGQLALCAAELGIPVIFGAGDRAFCSEAEQLVQGIRTVWVKRGLEPDRGDGLSFEQYERHALSALHCSPTEACRRICEGAREALERFVTQPQAVVIPQLRPPYEEIFYYRQKGGQAGYQTVRRHAESIIACLNATEQRAEG